MGLYGGNSLGEPLNKLTPDGELPFGWVSYRKDLIDKIESEISVFRRAIVVAQTSSQQLAAFKDYFQYLEDGKKHYSQIGECEGKYFIEYIVNSEETKGNKRKMAYVKRDLALDKKMISIIKKSPGITQKDVCKMFDPETKSIIQEKLRSAEKDGIIIREKFGSTYKLFIK